MVIPLDTDEYSSLPEPDSSSGARPRKARPEPSPEVIQEFVIRLRLVVSVNAVAEVEREVK